MPGRGAEGDGRGSATEGGKSADLLRWQMKLFAPHKNMYTPRRTGLAVCRYAANTIHSTTPKLPGRPRSGHCESFSEAAALARRSGAVEAGSGGSRRRSRGSSPGWLTPLGWWLVVRLGWGGRAGGIRYCRLFMHYGPRVPRQRPVGRTQGLGPGGLGEGGRRREGGNTRRGLGGVEGTHDQP